MKDEFWKQNVYGNVFVPFDEYSYNIKSVNIFSKLRGLWETISEVASAGYGLVNGMQLRELSCLIRSLYLLTIGESIIIASGHTQ